MLREKSLGPVLWRRKDENICSCTGLQARVFTAADGEKTPDPPLKAV